MPLLQLYIMLPVHNRVQLTRKFMESLVLQDFKDYHLVLIDDGSTDGTDDMVRSFVDNVTVIKGKGDWWWGGALHQGYRWLKKQTVSGDDVVLIINDDTEMPPDYLSTGVGILRNHPHSLLISQCYDRSTRTVVDIGAHCMDFRTMNGTTEGEANWLTTRGLFLRVADMLVIGGFHPVLLPHYLSDVEYTYRAFRKGMELLSEPQLKLYLDDSATGFHERAYQTESRRELIKRHFSKRSSANPIYWTTFILLCCPRRFMLQNLFNLWGATAGYLIRVLLGARVML